MKTNVISTGLMEPERVGLQTAGSQFLRRGFEALEGLVVGDPPSLARETRGIPGRSSVHPVAVLVSIAEYERLISQEEGFGRRLRDFLESVDREALVGDDPFAGLRDEDAGRDVAL